MLQSIYIQNYALIDKLNIDFTSGFSVITGETGAGKSIILGAIGLLLGQRADVKAIKNGATKCIVEARFVIASYGMEHFFMENDIEFDPEECILRREVSANGKVVLKSIDKQFVAYLNLIIICKIIFLVQIFKPDAIVL